MKTMFLVLSIKENEQNKYGGFFSIKELALERKHYLNQTYDGGWVVREYVLDYYTGENSILPSDTLE